MPDPYTIYRVICATPPGLDDERDLFLAANVDFAEKSAMPQGILFAPATFRTSFDANLNQAAVKHNIKTSTFFLQIHGQDPAEPVYKRFVEYALECQEDPALPLQTVTVLFKDAGDVAPEMTALRERFAALAPACDVRTFRKTKELAPIFEELLSGWLALVCAKT